MAHGNARGGPPAPGETRRAILWMIAASAAYAGVFATVRQLSSSLPLVELIFIRAVLGVILTAPAVIQSRLAVLRTRRIGGYFMRSVASFGGMLCWFYALSQLALADATALMFTLPIWNCVLAVLFLGERVGPYRIGAVVAGFVGALVIIRPGLEEVGLATFAALLTAAAYATVNIYTKSLVRTDQIRTVMFYMFFSIGLWSAAPAIWMWVTPSWADVPWIALFGLLSYGAQECLTRSLNKVDTTVVMPFNYLQLPFVAALGFILFGQTTDWWTWIGAAVIMASTYVLARREAAVEKAAHRRREEDSR